MGKIAGNTEEKSEIAKEICEIYARATVCASLHHPPTNKSPFINWYLLLQVDENADKYSIRKRYHKLALLLHPDKNSNSGAETAFKLVSEAYFCLSDITRRKAFDTERKSISCIKCNPYPCKKTVDSYTEIQKPASRFSRLQARVRELRDKLKEEAAIIEKCLVANAATKKAAGTRNESPVFEPSSYQHKSNFRHKNLRAALKMGMHNAVKRDDYPVFQQGSERVSSISR